MASSRVSPAIKRREIRRESGKLTINQRTAALVDIDKKRSRKIGILSSLGQTRGRLCPQFPRTTEQFRTRPPPSVLRLRRRSPRESIALEQTAPGRASKHRWSWTRRRV